MIVICEECGKKYRIDPEKIKGKAAKFKCKACDHVITITKPEEKTADQSPPPPVKEPSSPPEPEEKEKSGKSGTGQTPRPKLRRFGLRAKMIILFFIIPIILMIAAGLLYLRQLDTFSTLVTRESAKMLTKLAEKAVVENTRSVASQTRLYLLNNLSLKKEAFNSDHELRKVTIQKVGLSGYTALYEFPDPRGVWRTWAHVNPKIVGIDMNTLKEPEGKYSPGFWKVFTGVKKQKESRGYYTLRDKDGTLREMYMVCIPIKGTPYIISGNAYVDEFTLPVKKLESRANKLKMAARKANIAILGGSVILVALVVFLYGYTLSKRIRSLTEVAERISVGELDAEIEIQSNDEIGDLGEAIARMQDSIRLSIERLRKRG